MGKSTINGALYRTFPTNVYPDVGNTLEHLPPNYRNRRWIPLKPPGSVMIPRISPGVGFVDGMFMYVNEMAHRIWIKDVHQHTHVMGMMFFSNLEFEKWYRDLIWSYVHQHSHLMFFPNLDFKKMIAIDPKAHQDDFPVASRDSPNGWWMIDIDSITPFFSTIYR